MVSVVDTKHSLVEIEKILAEEGILRGTLAFVEALDARYFPDECVPGQYVERCDYIPTRAPSKSPATSRHVSHAFDVIT